MARLLTQRNAHTCVTLASGWLLFSLFAVWDWQDARRTVGSPETIVHFGVWGVQLLLIALAFYFRRTETPRLMTHWLADDRSSVSCQVRIEEVASVGQALAVHIPELTFTVIQEIQEAARQAQNQGEASLEIPISFRGGPERLCVSFECDDDGLEMFVVTHADFWETLDHALAPYQRWD